MTEVTVRNPLKCGRIDGHHVPDAIRKKRRHEYKRIVDRLPSELLSQIFIMSEELARKTRARTVSYNTVQEVASQVCSYWRQVAINTPALWTYIHISRPLPNPLASLYLERAGSTLLLDIGIEMRSRYWRKANIRINEWNKQLASLSELLHCLVSYGAAFRRWKSLSISSKHLEPLFVLILRLNTESAPFLERITFKRHSPKNTPNISLTSPYHSFNSEPAWMDDSDANVNSNRYCISRSALPSLRCMDFGFVPCDFIFHRPSPLFTGLTHLNLEINRDDAWSILSTHPFSQPILSSKRFLSAPKPVLSAALRSLSISATGPRHLTWILSILHMINAPALQSFTLKLDSSWNYNHELELCLIYISTGSTQTLMGRSESLGTESMSTGIGSIYPALRSLDISGVEASHTALEVMLLPLSTITRLSIGNYDSHLRVLSSSRNMLPNLVGLQITDKCNTSAVARCLYRRCELGIPVKDIIPCFTGHRHSKNNHFENQVPMFNKCDGLLDLDLTDDEHTYERTGSSSITSQNIVVLQTINCPHTTV